MSLEYYILTALIDYAGQVYQKKVKVDKDIVELVGNMDDVLSFVEDVDVLKDKLKRFTSTIEQILLTIDSCCSWVKKYLEANTPGMNLYEVSQFSNWFSRPNVESVCGIGAIK